MTPEQIRGLRMTLGLSQEQAATLSGVRSRTIRNWELGRTRPLRTKLHLYRTMMMATDNEDEIPLLRIMQHLNEATEAQASEVAKAMNLPRTTARTLLLRLCRLKVVEQFSPGWFAIRTPTQPREQ